jgi:DNA-binding NarL/FixJ family response regulator
MKPLPEVILLDIEMPLMDGIETTVKLKKKYPKIKPVILTMHDEQEMIIHLIERGARGFLPKNEDVEEVVVAIKSVQEIGYYFNDRVSQAMVKGLVNSEKIKPKFYSASLSDIELEIISLICKEFTGREIAEKMGLQFRTIEWHRNNILKKTGARNTAGIVMFAMKHNLVI